MLLVDEKLRRKHFENTGEWLNKSIGGLEGLGLSTLPNPNFDSIWAWVKTNWKWVLGIGAGVGIMIYLLKRKK